MRRVFHAALVLFFGWLLLDSILSGAFGRPLEGVYYPFATRYPSIALMHDWRTTPRWVPLFFLVLYGGVWLAIMRVARAGEGPRVASLVTGLAMPVLWVVPLVSADLYDLTLNPWWLASMAFSNAAFLIVGFAGAGRTGEAP